MYRVNFDCNCIIYFKINKKGCLMNRYSKIYADEKGVYFLYKTSRQNKKIYLTQQNYVNYNKLIKNDLVEE